MVREGWGGGWGVEEGRGGVGAGGKEGTRSQVLPLLSNRKMEKTH